MQRRQQGEMLAATVYKSIKGSDREASLKTIPGRLHYLLFGEKRAASNAVEVDKARVASSPSFTAALDILSQQVVDAYVANCVHA